MESLLPILVETRHRADGNRLPSDDRLGGAADVGESLYGAPALRPDDDDVDAVVIDVPEKPLVRRATPAHAVDLDVSAAGLGFDRLRGRLVRLVRAVDDRVEPSRRRVRPVDDRERVQRRVAPIDEVDRVAAATAQSLPSVAARTAEYGRSR